MEIWHCFLGHIPHTSLLESLTQAGLRAHEYKSSQGNGPGVVFFEESSFELLDLLRETSRKGRERVLAISVSRAALEPAVIWRLLNAGAADVFAWERRR
jgi:hypothetical protein